MASSSCKKWVPFAIVSFALLAHAQSRSGPPKPMRGTVVDYPEQITGLWESDDGSGGAVGLNFQLITELKGQPKTFRGRSKYWDSLQIGVYQRQGSERHVGDANWIMDNSPGVHFDGKRLVARMPDLAIDLGLSYDNKNQIWSGWFHRGAFARQVLLSRPRAKPGISKSRLVGTWLEGQRAARMCLHVVQQSDGDLGGMVRPTISVWLIPICSGSIPLPWTSEYYGEQGIVSESGHEVLRFEVRPYSAGCCSPVFVGKLSEGGDRLTGRWDGGNAPGSHEWRRVDGDSCVQAYNKEADPTARH
jgi:hypothetical protein